jgi:hypothetical protein
LSAAWHWKTAVKTHSAVTGFPPSDSAGSEVGCTTLSEEFTVNAEPSGLTTGGCCSGGICLGTSSPTGDGFVVTVINPEVTVLLVNVNQRYCHKVKYRKCKHFKKNSASIRHRNTILQYVNYASNINTN